MTLLPSIQLSLRPGIVEFGWGHPDSALLPVEDIARAAAHTLAQDGRLALAYGAEQGPGNLITPICTRLGHIDGTAPPAEQIFITGGVSQALDLLCTTLTRPGDIALVEAPTYHLALRILRDHKLHLIPIPADQDGLRIDLLEQQLAGLRSQGQTARLLYTVPTFSNPTGISMTVERRHALVELAQRVGLTVIEDDVYRELWYDATPPPSLFSLAPLGPIIRLGSFAKILAPGLRLGWLLAAPEIVQRCVKSGLLDSGGGVNHFTAQIVGTFLELNLLDKHVATLRVAYKQRRDALLSALRRYLPTDCTWRTPQGSFFVWIRLPANRDSAALLPQAEAAGVSYLPGALFHASGGGKRYLRLSFALLPAAEMEEGARRLGAFFQTLS
ncbi:MAG: PLP-dependent aminotransferase family protein [Chloroflexales bacterium]|nr:PLP-dependent aminotransferase family protein [Chloroflexales bacterium]